MKYTKLMNPTSDKRETANVWNNVACVIGEKMVVALFVLRRREKKRRMKEIKDGCVSIKGKS